MNKRFWYYCLQSSAIALFLAISLPVYFSTEKGVFQFLLTSLLAGASCSFYVALATFEHNRRANEGEINGRED